MGIYNILHISTSKKGIMFLKYHFCAILIFAFIYYLQSMFMFKYPELGKKLGFGKKGHKYRQNIFYWVWFSAITQTTIGYAGATPANDSGNPIILTNRLFKFINLCQIFSIFTITSWLI